MSLFDFIIQQMGILLLINYMFSVQTFLKKSRKQHSSSS